MTIGLVDIGWIAITLDEGVLIFAGWHQAIHQKGRCFLGFVTNIMDRTAKAAEIASIQHFCNFCLLLSSHRTSICPLVTKIISSMDLW